MGSILRRRLGLRPVKSNGTYVLPAGELPKLERLFGRYGVGGVGMLGTLEGSRNRENRRKAGLRPSLPLLRTNIPMSLMSPESERYIFAAMVMVTLVASSLSPFLINEMETVSPSLKSLNFNFFPCAVIFVASVNKYVVDPTVMVLAAASMAVIAALADIACVVVLAPVVATLVVLLFGGPPGLLEFGLSGPGLSGSGLGSGFSCLGF